VTATNVAMQEYLLMKKIRIQFTWLTAFYAPLVVTLTRSFLKSEGLDCAWSVATPGRSAVDALLDGSADVVQTTLTNAFGFLNQGKPSPCLHFAVVNEMDGFFLTARQPQSDFNWKNLEGSKLLILHGGQPMQMFKYACLQRGIDINKIQLLNLPPADMDQAFRDGVGDYIHQQGPAPQQLVADGAGHIVSTVGPAVGPCSFSSLAATREWLQTEEAVAFAKAYKAAKAYLVSTAATALADDLASYFPSIQRSVLVQCIHDYQQLGCWTEEIAITDSGYQAMLNIYEATGGINQRYDYADVCSRPPGY
jgi:NitT/TauT family transport system substrate-binding protein